MTKTTALEANAVEATRAGINAEQAVFFDENVCPARADALTAETGVKIA